MKGIKVVILDESSGRGWESLLALPSEGDESWENNSKVEQKRVHRQKEESCKSLWPFTFTMERVVQPYHLSPNSQLRDHWIKQKWQGLLWTLVMITHLLPCIISQCFTIFLSWRFSMISNSNISERARKGEPQGLHFYLDLVPGIWAYYPQHMLFQLHFPHLCKWDCARWALRSLCCIATEIE